MRRGISPVCPEPSTRMCPGYPVPATLVLLTDDEPGQRAFYESLGFAETRDFDDGSLRALVKFD